jgi:hypothetical protein
MNDYPHSPYGRARHALELFDQGALAPPEFLAQLDSLGASVEAWSGQLDAIPSQGYQEGRELIDDARESLQAVREGTDMLREYAHSRRPEEAREALELLAEASEFLAQLLSITEQNMEELEDQR